MDNKKFEKLIDLIINENEEKARELFHEIVVEKSREIYESIMDEEMMGQGMGGQVGDLMDEISAEEAGGMVEADDEGMDDFGDEDLMGDEEVVDIEAGDMDDMGGSGEEVEDAVVRIEDKLDQLMAEFEELMGGEEGEEDFGGEEEAGEEDFGGEEEAGEEDFGGEEGEEDFGGEEEAEEVMEAIQLKQIGGKTYNTYGQMGDNGANTKSIALKDPKVKVPGVNPVNFTGTESVPTGPKAPSNAYTKGETQVKGAGSFKNSPAKDNFSEKGEAAPKPKHGDNGVNTKSPLGEGKKTVKRIVR